MREIKKTKCNNKDIKRRKKPEEGPFSESLWQSDIEQPQIDILNNFLKTRERPISECISFVGIHYYVYQIKPYQDCLMLNTLLFATTKTHKKGLPKTITEVKKVCQIL